MTWLCTRCAKKVWRRARYDDGEYKKPATQQIRLRWWWTGVGHQINLSKRTQTNDVSLASFLLVWEPKARRSYSIWQPKGLPAHHWHCVLVRFMLVAAAAAHWTSDDKKKYDRKPCIKHHLWHCWRRWGAVTSCERNRRKVTRKKNEKWCSVTNLMAASATYLRRYHFSMLTFSRTPCHCHPSHAHQPHLIIQIRNMRLEFTNATDEWGL